MSLETILYSLASVPMFAARPFLAALVTALLARFGDHVPFLANSKVVIALGHSPEWFQSWTMLFVLAALAAAEVWATKSSDVRAFMADFDGWVKAAVSLAVSLALIDKGTAHTIEGIQRHGLDIYSVWALFIGAATYFVALVRQAAMWIIHEVDDDDDVGLQTALSWIESTWTVSGIFFIVIFPIAAVVLSALTALALYGLKRWKEKRDERTKLPCTQCGTPVFPHATQCPKCRHEVAVPRAVGVFGTARASPCKDRDRQRFELIGRKRCPVCATRLKERNVQQACPECRVVTFASDREFHLYLDVLAKRLPKTLLISFALSAIPIVGVVPGVIYYRLTLISGLRGYVPAMRGCFARVLLFFIRWLLIALQPIPIVGAIVIPLMCLSSYAIYRRALVGRARKDLTTRLAA